MSVEPVIFRGVAKDDYEDICNLITSEEELFLFYAQGRHPLTTAQVEALVKRRKEPTIMLYRGKVAGFGNFYGYKKEQSIFIGNIIVVHSLRGKGLGKQLIRHMMNLAFERYGLPMVKLHVFNRNLPGLLLYTSMGFKPYAMKVKQDFNGEPVVQLSLRLKRNNIQV